MIAVGGFSIQRRLRISAISGKRIPLTSKIQAHPCHENWKFPTHQDNLRRFYKIHHRKRELIIFHAAWHTKMNNPTFTFPRLPENAGFWTPGLAFLLSMPHVMLLIIDFVLRSLLWICRRDKERSFAPIVLFLFLTSNPSTFFLLTRTRAVYISLLLISQAVYFFIHSWFCEPLQLTEGPCASLH